MPAAVSKPATVPPVAACRKRRLEEFLADMGVSTATAGRSNDLGDIVYISPFAPNSNLGRNAKSYYG
jgi:hypothetical protein